MHQNLLPKNNNAQSTTNYGFLLQLNAQIVALRTHCMRTALKAPPMGGQLRLGNQNVINWKQSIYKRTRYSYIQEDPVLCDQTNTHTHTVLIHHTVAQHCGKLFA